MRYQRGTKTSRRSRSTAAQDPLGDELRLRDERAQTAARSAPLREAFGLDEAGEDRVHADPARPQLGGDRARERELRVLRGRVRAARAGGDRARDRDHVRRRRRAPPPRAPAGRRAGTRRRRGSSSASPPRSARAEARRKPPRPGTPALLTSSEIARVALDDRGGRALDRLAVADVAESPTPRRAPRRAAAAAPRRARAARTPSRARASALATAAPIPLEPPVTTATGGTRGRRRVADAVAPRRSVTTRAQDVAAAGAPCAVRHGVV